MSSIGVRDLKAHVSEILRRVEREGEIIDVTRRGAVVARLVPVSHEVNAERLARLWEEEDRLAAEIAEYWPAGISAAEAIAEDRE
jgi:prevent-host-death family protein